MTLTSWFRRLVRRRPSVAPAPSATLKPAPEVTAAVSFKAATASVRACALAELRVALASARAAERESQAPRRANGHGD